MSARKAYISSLGTTGVLITGALVMLILVGALVAFDRWPTHAVAEAETVPIARDGTASIGRAIAEHGAAERRSLARRIDGSRVRALPGVAARAGKVEQGSGQAALAAPVADPVVSELPAPDTTAEQPASAPTAAPPPPETSAAGQDPVAGARPQPPVLLPPGTIDPSSGNGLTEVTSGLGDKFAQVSPSLGQTVRSTGATADATVRSTLATADGAVRGLLGAGSR